MSTVFTRFLPILGSKVGGFLLGIVITPLLVRVLGSSLYGDYAFIAAIIGLGMIFVNAGIFDGTRKFISERRDDEQWEAHVIGFYGRIAVLFAVIAGVIAFFVARLDIIAETLGPSFEIYLALVGIVIFFQQTFNFFRGCLMGFGDERYTEPIQVGRKVVFGVAGISLAALGYGVTGVLVGKIIALGLASVGLIMLLRHHIGSWVSVLRIPKDFPRRELLGFNVYTVVLISLIASLYHFDIMMLRLLAGSKQTGYYKASLVVAEFLWFAPIAAQIVLLQSSSELWSKNDIDSIKQIASKTTRFTAALTILMAIGIGSMADVFVPLYFGAEFTPTVVPLLLLLPGVVGFAVARPILAIGQGKGTLKPLIYATGVASLINLVLNLLLIPLYGIEGAAIATSVGYGSMLLLHIRAARKIGFDPVHDLRPLRLALVGVLSGVPIATLAQLLPPMPSLLVVPPVGLSIYLILSLKIGVIDAEEMRDLSQHIPHTQYITREYFG